MNDKQLVDMLLNKEVEINSKINNGILEILRLGGNTERGKKIIPDLIEGIKYSLEDIERIIQRT